MENKRRRVRVKKHSMIDFVGEDGHLLETRCLNEDMYLLIEEEKSDDKSRLPEVRKE